QPLESQEDSGVRTAEKVVAAWPWTSPAAQAAWPKIQAWLEWAWTTQAGKEAAGPGWAWRSRGEGAPLFSRRGLGRPPRKAAAALAVAWMILAAAEAARRGLGRS